MSEYRVGPAQNRPKRSRVPSASARRPELSDIALFVTDERLSSLKEWRDYDPTRDANRAWLSIVVNDFDENGFFADMHRAQGAREGDIAGLFGAVEFYDPGSEGPGDSSTILDVAALSLRQECVQV
jgi:hypothetical protein